MLGQTVASPTHGLDQAGSLHWTERFSQAFDVDVDGAFFNEDMIAPHAVQQLRPAVHPLRVRHHEVQQSKLGRTDLDLAELGAELPVDAAGGWIESQAIDLDCGVQRLRRLASQDSTNAGQQLLG